MEINKPDVVAEVTEAHDRYEAALAANDVETLNELFWASPLTLRYGPTENLYGHEAIAEFRRSRPGHGVVRRVTTSVITAYGDDFATTNLQYVRPDSGRIGRQSQSWARTPEGWRIVAAHVSDMVEPG